MTTTTITLGDSVAEARGLPLDSLDLRDAVIGDGLMLSRDSEDRWVLHSLEGGRAQHLGTFADVAQALRLLDSLEGY
jgi:hypothetical protein